MSLETVLAQGHLALEEVSAGTEALVFGGNPCTAEEKHVLLHKALSSLDGHSWKHMVHLGFQGFALDIQSFEIIINNYLFKKMYS